MHVLLYYIKGVESDPGKLVCCDMGTEILALCLFHIVQNLDGLKILARGPFFRLESKLLSCLLVQKL